MLFSSYHAKQQAVIHHSGIQQALGSHHNTLQMRYPTSFLRLHICSQPSETLFTGLLTRDRSIAGHFITYHLLQPLHFSPFIHVLQVSHSSFFVLFFLSRTHFIYPSLILSFDSQAVLKKQCRSMTAISVHYIFALSSPWASTHNLILKISFSFVPMFVLILTATDSQYGHRNYVNTSLYI